MDPKYLGEQASQETQPLFHIWPLLRGSSVIDFMENATYEHGICSLECRA